MTLLKLVRIPLFLTMTTLLFVVTPIYATTFEVRNNCPYTVWGAAVPGGGRQMNPGDTWVLNVNPGTTAARIWARTGCRYTRIITCVTTPFFHLICTSSKTFKHYL